MKLVYLIIILLSLLAYKFVDLWSIKSYELKKTEEQSSIIQGNMTFPFKYSVLVPRTAYVLQKIIRPLVETQSRSIIYSYELINLISILLIFTLFYFFLRLFFTEMTSMLGLFLFLAVIPLSVSGIWPEVNLLNFLFYLIGFILIFKAKDQFLPLLIAIGMLNDESIIFLIAFYFIYLVSDKKLTEKKSFIVIILSVLSGAAVYVALRWKFGFQTGENFIRVFENIANISSILQLWIAEVFMFVFLSIKSYRSSSKFFKLSFVSLTVYTILFFLFGNMIMFGKFFPAYLILIPMTLQVLTPETTVKEN